MKGILNLMAVMILTTGCVYHDIRPSASADESGNNWVDGSNFFFGKTSGPDTFAPTPYNLYKISGGRLLGAYIPRINPDSLDLYPLIQLPQEKYQTVAELQSLLPSAVFSEKSTRIGLMNIDSGYDFIKISMEAGATKFFYIGDAGVPDYLIPFKQALDQDLGKLSH